MRAVGVVVGAPSFDDPPGRVQAGKDMLVEAFVAQAADQAFGKGQILLADRAYDSDALRAAMTDRGAWANIKPMPHRVNVPAFSPWLYRYRNLVERFFNKLKHSRAVATRFEKHDANYLALVKLAAARIWMRFMSR